MSAVQKHAVKMCCLQVRDISCTEHVEYYISTVWYHRILPQGTAGVSYQSREAEPPPLPCWPCCSGCSPGYVWLSGMWAHIAVSCSAFHPAVPSALLSRFALNAFIPQHALTPGAALTQVQELPLGLVKLHEIHTEALLQQIVHFNFFSILKSTPVLYVTRILCHNVRTSHT